MPGEIEEHTKAQRFARRHRNRCDDLVADRGDGEVAGIKGTGSVRCIAACGLALAWRPASALSRKRSQKNHGVLSFFTVFSFSSSGRTASLGIA